MQSFPCHNDQFAAQIWLIFHSPVEEGKKKNKKKTHLVDE